MDPAPRRRGLRRVMTTWIATLAGLYASWLVVLYLLQDRMVFPRHLIAAPRDLAGPGIEPLTLDTDQGTVPAWLWMPPNTSRPAPLAVVLHGNGESADNTLDLARRWHQRGWAVLIPEYRGYGRSAGSPTQHRLVQDTLRFIEETRTRPGVDPSLLVLHGRSLGGAVAVLVAARLPPSHRPAALILQSTFTSVADLAARMLAPGVLVRHPFPVRQTLRTLDIPVLILHGTEDEIVPLRHAQRLAQAARNAEVVLLPGHHNDFPLDEEAYWHAIDDFLARRLPPGGAP